MEDHEREETEGMNMQENARLVLGLRAAGWDEKKINDFFSLHRDRRRTVQAQAGQRQIINMKRKAVQKWAFFLCVNH